MIKDILKRSKAPIIEDAWKQIDEQARSVLELNLAARKLVDFKGPYGWKFAAVSTGRLTMLEKGPLDGVPTGVRKVQPLIETRVPFVLDIMELDTIARGADDPDLDPVIAAAEKIARAEDTAVFHGFAAAGITGIIGASPHAPIDVANVHDWPRAIVQAKEALRSSGVQGPYALALSIQAYDELSAGSEDGYPLRQRIERNLIDGPLVWAPALQVAAVLLSIRGGDFELAVGQDLSVGYVGHDREKVELYVTESFTFRVLEEKAAIALRRV